MSSSPLLPFFVLHLLALCAIAQNATTPFFIKVIDRETKRGVPLVEFKTVHGLRYVTDNAGIIAIDDLDLIGQSVFFHVESHGYHYPKDGFGYAGVRFTVTPGQSKTIEIRRDNLAERLYRVTGAGQYIHQARTGQSAPVAAPLLAAQVTGCDSVLNAIYQDRLFWIWGDTNRLRYPLGNFDATAATSRLPNKGGLSPDIGVNFDYFTREDGFVKGIAPMAGKGPTWLSALVTLPDASGKERLCATYVKVRGFLEVYERGLCVFDPDKQVFERIHVFPTLDGHFPDGHACIRDGMAYFGQAVPNLRIEARYEAWLDPERYQPLKADVNFFEAGTRRPIKAHHGHCAWNAYRGAWISIFTETGGVFGPLSDIYYAEAAKPEGPWRRAVKIVSHNNYTFYNPAQHPWFSQSDESQLYFEGTFTKLFSKTQVGVPRYDYNQIMYRLDLTMPALRPAQLESRTE